eukprot:TRINITY_DN885_c2_g1_i10.p1 TRINITY_DN885_c2_g1~~TRINITY_DN885_c2_g1_i10.p1  ORF type:complete len:268 (+),score=31.75 TRINITY_DN885_c2_g1_i10:999-1802(+)
MAVNVVYLKYNEDVQEFEHPLRREDKEMIESSFGITLKRILEGTTVKAIDRLEKGKTYTVEGNSKFNGAIDAPDIVPGISIENVDLRAQQRAIQIKLFEKYPDGEVHVAPENVPRGSLRYEIKGAVANSGPFWLPLDMRLKDLISAVGGYGDLADRKLCHAWEDSILGAGIYNIPRLSFLSLGMVKMREIMTGYPQLEESMDRPISEQSARSSTWSPENSSLSTASQKLLDCSPPVLEGSVLDSSSQQTLPLRRVNKGSHVSKTLED